MKTFYEYELNNKKIVFHKDNEILVQTGKGKQSYKDTWTFKAENFAKAVFQFNCINIGNGYKKRIICHSLNKPLLARQFS